MRFSVAPGVKEYGGQAFLDFDVPGATNDCAPLAISVALHARAMGVGTSAHPTISADDLAELAARASAEVGLIRAEAMHGRDYREPGFTCAGEVPLDLHARSGQEGLGVPFDEPELAGFVAARARSTQPVHLTAILPNGSRRSYGPAASSTVPEIFLYYTPSKSGDRDEVGHFSAWIPVAPEAREAACRQQRVTLGEPARAAVSAGLDGAVELAPPLVGRAPSALAPVPPVAAPHADPDVEANVKAIAAVIRKKLRSLDTFLDAQDQKDHKDKLLRPLKYDAPGQREKLEAQLEQAIDHSAKVFAAKGWTAEDVAKFANKAWRADLGATFMQKTISNAVAYTPMSVAGIAASLMLAPILGPIPMIFAGAAVALGVGYKWSVHALKAAGEVDKKVNDEKAGRGRFWKVSPSKGRVQAVGKEVAADLAGRTGPRLLLTGPLRVLKLMGAAGGFTAALGVIIAPISAVIGPPTNALMQVFSKMLHARRKHRSAAPLFGIEFKIKKDESGHPIAQTAEIGTDAATIAKHVNRNIERLSKPALVRTASMLRKLVPEYVATFPNACDVEQQKGMTREKWVELICGSSAIGQGLGVAFGLGGDLMGGMTGQDVSGLGGIAASTAGNATNPVTRGEVGRHFPYWLTDAKKPAPDKPKGAAKRKGAMTPGTTVPVTPAWSQPAPLLRPILSAPPMLPATRPFVFAHHHAPQISPWPIAAAQPTAGERPATATAAMVIPTQSSRPAAPLQAEPLRPLQVPPLSAGDSVAQDDASAVAPIAAASAGAVVQPVVVADADVTAEQAVRSARRVPLPLLAISDVLVGSPCPSTVSPQRIRPRTPVIERTSLMADDSPIAMTGGYPCRKRRSCLGMRRV